MPGDVIDSRGLAAAIRARDFSDRAVTVIGYGNVGKEYVKALHSLGVGRVRVCSRSSGPLEALQCETIAGGFHLLDCAPQATELAIIATPALLLAEATEHAVSLGFKRLLIEKPVALYSKQIEQLAALAESNGVKATVAYNRRAYPAYHEVKARVANEGGATSCAYAFTEMIKDDWFDRFPAEELGRWGVSNSIHVLSMAHGLIELPETWSGQRTGSLPWHPSGAVFVGSGVSETGVPFSYHADWGSKGRWSVEVHSREAAYSLCPMEKLFRKSSPLDGWSEVPLTFADPEVKPGFVEQVAANLADDGDFPALSPSLADAAALVRYAERVFGYSEQGGAKGA